MFCELLLGRSPRPGKRGDPGKKEPLRSGKQRGGMWLIPGHIFWLYHPWLIHHTKGTAFFNQSHNPRSALKQDLSLNEWLLSLVDVFRHLAVTISVEQWAPSLRLPAFVVYFSYYLGITYWWLIFLSFLSYTHPIHNLRDSPDFQLSYKKQSKSSKL